MHDVDVQAEESSACLRYVCFASRLDFLELRQLCLLVPYAPRSITDEPRAPEAAMRGAVRLPTGAFVLPVSLAPA